MFDSIPSDVTIDRERFVDSTVNLIPIGIMAFFLVLFLLFNPFSPSWFFTVLMVGLHLVPIVLLGLLTYVSLKVIGRDEIRNDTQMDGATTPDLEAEPSSQTAGDSD